MADLKPNRMEKAIRIMLIPNDIVPTPTHVTVLENEVSCVFLILRATNKGKFIFKSQVYNAKKISDI
jgi:hypothetical protein